MSVGNDLQGVPAASMGNYRGLLARPSCYLGPERDTMAILMEFPGPLIPEMSPLQRRAAKIPHLDPKGSPDLFIDELGTLL